jgi:predicted glycogen debranching enzyme
VTEDHLYLAQLQVTLRPGESFACRQHRGAPNLDSALAYGDRQAHEPALLERAGDLGGPAVSDDTRDALRHLVLAADQFVVAGRRPPTPTASRSSPATRGSGDWGRDTMIALPGLTLATDRPEVAASILRTYAQFVDQGMLPNRFPDVGETPEYNTVDATLWYFVALHEVVAATGDLALARELFPCWPISSTGTSAVRATTSTWTSRWAALCREEGVQLTWMDA